MKKFVAVIVMVVLMTMVSANAEMMSFDQFCRFTKIGDVIEQPDGTYKMVMETINGYKIVVTAPVYEAEEADVAVVCLDGYVWEMGRFTIDNVEENMFTIMNWMYNEYVESWA